jgi:hypothetical protein
VKNPLPVTKVRPTGQTALSSEAATVLGLLAPGYRELLQQIAQEGRGHFGARSTQSIFDATLPALEALYAIDAEHDHIADLLAELGIRDARGRKLSRGTVSSAVYRARLKTNTHLGEQSPQLGPNAGVPPPARHRATSPEPLASDQRARAGPLPTPIPLQSGSATSLATAAAFLHRMRDQDE